MTPAPRCATPVARGRTTLSRHPASCQRHRSRKPPHNLKPQHRSQHRAQPAPVRLAPAADGMLPRLVADVALAPEGETLFDLRVDRAGNRLFVTDTGGQLHVLDATTYEPITVLPFGGWLELDAPNQRLYVFQPYLTQDQPPLIHVIDTTTLAEVGTLPGSALAVDSAQNRLFVGDRFAVTTAPDAPGVRIVDGATLEQTGIFTQTGAPIYNPQRDEVLILAYTVYTADPATQQVTGDLFPELTAVGPDGFLWCNGCTWADDGRFLSGGKSDRVGLDLPLRRQRLWRCAATALLRRGVHDAHRSRGSAARAGQLRQPGAPGRCCRRPSLPESVVRPLCRLHQPAQLRPCRRPVDLARWAAHRVCQPEHKPGLSLRWHGHRPCHIGADGPVAGGVPLCL